MAKVMNVVFGIGVAVLLYLVVLLGINVFYPEPKFEDYCDEFPRPIPIDGGKEAPTNEDLEKSRECNENYRNDREIYGRNVFVIASIVGTIFVVVSFYLLSMMSIASGIALSGLAVIIYGFATGWRGTGDVLKFIIGIIVAAVVIYLAIKIHKKSD